MEKNIETKLSLLGINIRFWLFLADLAVFARQIYFFVYLSLYHCCNSDEILHNFTVWNVDFDFIKIVFENFQ